MIPDEGWFVDDDLLGDAECKALIAAVAGATTVTGRAGARHLMRHPAVASLAGDQRLLARARRVLGDGAVPYRATLFSKSPRANWLVVWHQDTALPLESRFEADGWGPWSEKEGILYAHAPTWALRRVLALRVHLDASTARNGPLRVIPGSHAAGVLDDDAVRARAAAGPSIECSVPRGGVLGMSPLLIHASSKAIDDAPRRVLHIEYADQLELGDGIRLAIA